MHGLHVMTHPRGCLKMSSGSVRAPAPADQYDPIRGTSEGAKFILSDQHASSSRSPLSSSSSSSSSSSAADRCLDTNHECSEKDRLTIATFSKWQRTAMQESGRRRWQHPFDCQHKRRPRRAAGFKKGFSINSKYVILWRTCRPRRRRSKWHSSMRGGGK
jgi:hypothetical protein